MKYVKKLIIAAMAIMSMGVAACSAPASQGPTARQVQAQKAAEAANSIAFSENAEIDNIKRRLELTSKPSAVGYILLLNEMGSPILYTGVKGKVTSGSKRLSAPGSQHSYNEHGYEIGSKELPSDEGTYGSSNPYIFFWTTSGQYIQWSGQYLYSDKPIRTRVAPLVVDVQAAD